MSHRVTTKSSMTDRAIIEGVCKRQGIGFSVSGTTLQFTSGPLSRATLDLRTGNIQGDTDYHNETVLGSLRQAYSLDKVKYEHSKNGVMVERQEQDGDDILLHCAVG